MLEALGIVACVLTASLVWLRSWWGPGRALGAFAIVAAAALAVALAPRARSAPAGAPGERPRQGYVSSNVCQSCHPSEYASWHRSYHRTMTQVASSKSVLAPFDGTHLEVDGRSIDLEQRGEEFWARLPDPDLVADAARAGSNEPSAAAPLVRRRVLMTTGSHHYQVYWVGGRRGNELRLLPAVYLLAERRWVPRKDAFLQPSGAHAQTVRWNSNCVQCHSVAGRPQHDEASDQFATEAVELGIACESCHGPGQAHVQKQHNPAQRYLTRWSGGNDETIVNPLRLDQARASQICGQCHAYFVPRDENSWWRAGFAETYRAGESLERSRLLLEPSRAEWRAAVEADPDSIFWPDGTIRIGGREYNGMVRSACYERGHGPKKLSCLSCHSMHQSEPDDQLSEAGSSDAACSKCHAELSRQGSAHTHHAADSPGSRCIGCHMPFTSYALFKGIRSHRVDSPSVNRELAAPRPNACNLCHTDRSLGWSAGYLTRWYGQPVPVLNDRERDFSAILQLLYAGDAAERAVAAYALGRPESSRASGAGYQAPHLAALLDDPYSALRLVAYRALRVQPGFADFAYDFLAPPELRRDSVSRALEIARQHAPHSAEGRLLLSPDGTPEPSTIAELRAARDDRPITIAE